MDLQDTVNGMLSNDYKERFKAEYYQLKIRHNKLCALLDKEQYGLGFELPSDKNLYAMQVKAMEMYLIVLKQRAKDEGIELEEV